VRSRGDEAMFIADVMHQPVQVYEPAWNSKYCEDPLIAAQTRRQILDYCADRGCLILPAHFGFPHCGTVGRDGDGFTFTPFAGDPNP
jgi:hypothetical protein